MEKGEEKNGNDEFPTEVEKVKTKERKAMKVVHVHFIHGHKNYYFGSVRAIYKKFTKEDIGCSEIYLRHQLTGVGNKFLNDKVLVIRSELLR